MISRKLLVRAIAGCCLSVAWGGLGCLSMQSQSSLDGPNAASSSGNQPYVEALIEYPGAQGKWAGPSSYIVHVIAKDAGAAQITLSPELTPVVPPMVSQRNPAAVQRMSGDEAREQIATLASAMQGAQVPFHGCLSPVRVRLVRADSGIFERQGCRSEVGWPRAVSDAVSRFTEAYSHGSQQTTQAAAPAEQKAVPIPSEASVATSSGHP